MLAPDGRREHITAASGLARAGHNLYVVADDRHSLAVFDLRSGEPGRVVPLGTDAGALAKPLKPDLEAVTVVPEGGLLVLGSGSTARRRSGVLWPLDDDGGLTGEPRRVDLGPLYDRLAGELLDLNIEGAAASGDRLLLFQRGNGPGGVNAVITLDLSRGMSPGAVESIERHDLGDVGGVRLAFTDACADGDEILFTAVAEAGEDTYEDGALAGAVVGVLGGATELVEPPVKVEGIEVVPGGLLLVADPDDPDLSVPLLAAPRPGAAG